MESKNFVDKDAAQLNLALNVGLVGASGCLFGLLIAYGMLFPNSELMLLFIPFPIKARYFVIGYGVIELLLALADRQGDNVAHYAHIGGMLIGYVILKFWQRQGRLYS
jgi:membrane associated rhomboid family serine protease